MVEAVQGSAPFQLTMETIIFIFAMALSQVALIAWLVSNVSMQSWKEFLDSLDSDGGKILLLEVATVFGTAMMILTGYQTFAVFFGGAGGALLAVLKMTGSNAARQEEIKQVQTDRIENPPGKDIPATPEKVD